MFGGVTTYVCLEPITLLSHLEMYCEAKKITKVVSTNLSILSRLVGAERKVSLSNYAGSVFSLKSIEIVFIDPLAQLQSVPYGRFLTARYISKVISPENWSEPTRFSFSVLDAPSKLESAYHELSSAFAIAIDIETYRHNLAIRCVGYTGIFIRANGVLETSSYVVPLDSEYNLEYVRKINTLRSGKIFQNGKYDNSYLLRYNSMPTDWLWDTAHLMHCTYSELPKDLAFINAFYLRKVVYWKDLAETTDLYEYYKYNALDTWATANVWIQQMLSIPDYARHNYLLEFPLVYPCLLAEMTGVERDTEKLEKIRGEIDFQEKEELGSLRKCIGAPAFNPGSPVQVKSLLKVLGCGDLTSSDEKNLNAASYRHPLNGRILSKILTIRGLRKLATTYLRIPSDADPKSGDGGAKEYKGRILYALNPHGTDTGRLASREHHFWCGLQIQNIPRGAEVKSTIRASNGFFLGECDLEQAESRDTANISGDASLIAAVSGTRDFHSINASSFFGVPYESIYDDSSGKTKDKKLRDLAKRVNHGANYNMGAMVLVETMGLDKIWEARRLLKLSVSEPKAIAAHLLAQFHKTYPSIAGKYYVSVINEIGLSSKLVSRAYHHKEDDLSDREIRAHIDRGDWTRYCFGKPEKNKSHLNAYVAHCPQSLNARTLNEAFLEMFYKIALPNPDTFRLHAQIHDSILFSYKNGYQSHAEAVRKCMEIPVTVRDVSGTYRTFTVPAALKLGSPGNPATYWSETE